MSVVFFCFYIHSLFLQNAVFVYGIYKVNYCKDSTATRRGFRSISNISYDGVCSRKYFAAINRLLFSQESSFIDA